MALENEAGQKPRKEPNYEPFWLTPYRLSQLEIGAAYIVLDAETTQDAAGISYKRVKLVRVGRKED